MSNTETPEQFRGRITLAAHSSMSLPPGDADYWAKPMKAGDPCHHMPMQKSDFSEVALAVYTQALREVYDALEDRIENEDQRAWLVEGVGAFAAERGLDLTESES